MRLIKSENYRRLQGVEIAVRNHLVLVGPWWQASHLYYAQSTS